MNRTKMNYEGFRRGMLVLTVAAAVGLAGVLAAGCGDNITPTPDATPKMMPMPDPIPPPRPDVPDDATPSESSLWSAYHYIVYDFVVGQVNNTANLDGAYVCSNSDSFRMYVIINQSYDGTPAPGTMPAVWHTRVSSSTGYLLNAPERALSTLNCPNATMAYSSQYAVLYNTAPLNCTLYGHAANGPLKAWAVTVPVAGLQQVAGTNAYLPYWVVGYSGSSPWQDGTGYCGPASRTFGS